MGNTIMEAVLLATTLGALPPASAAGPCVDTVLPLGASALNDHGR